MTERKRGRTASPRAADAGVASGQLRHRDAAVSGQLGREVVRVLLLEDRDTDAELVERALRKAGFAYTFERTRDEAGFLASLDPPPHVIISDYYVPGCDALHALRLVRSRGLDIPFILVSGVIGEARALEAMRLGATDFLLKDRLGRLGSAMRTALELAALRRKANGARQKADRTDNEFREAFDNAAIGMALTTLDGRWLKVNAALESIIGYTADELHHRDCANLIHPDDSREDAASLRQLLAGEINVLQREQRYMHKAGQPLWVQVTASLARDAAGRPLYRVLQVIDASESRRTRARLARADRARKVMAECSHALLHATDERLFLQQMCRIVVDSGGYVQAYVGLAQDDEEQSILPAASAGFEEGYLQQRRRNWKKQARAPSVMGDVIASGKRFISRDIYADAQLRRWVERARSKGYQSLLCLPLRIEDRCIGGISIYAREPEAFDDEEIALLTGLAGDIEYGINHLRTRAAREQAERAVRENERRFELTFDHAAVGIGLSDLDGCYLQANQRFADMLGYTREEMSGLSIRKLMHPDDVGLVGELRRQLLAGEVDSVAGERRFFRKDGRLVWVNRTVSLARDAAGEPLCFITVAHDITATKQREESYRVIFENAAVGITCVDLTGALVDVNQKFCDLLGYTREELRGKAVRDITYPEDFSQGERFRAQLSRGDARSASGEKRFVRKDGAVIWARRTMSTVLDQAGNPQYVISVVEDISEHKRAEGALRTSEEVLRATFSQAAVGIFLTTPDSRYLQVNDKYCDMLGYSRDELLKMSIKDVYSPANIADVLANRARLVRGELDQSNRERQLLRKDGSLIWVSHSTSLVRDQKGAPLYFITIAEDVTERKEVTERYRATFDNAPVGIMHTSIDSDRIMHANSKLCEMLGYSQQELLSTRTDALIHPDYVGMDRTRYRERMLKGELDTFSSERLYRRKDGSDLWVNRTVSLARDVSGRPLYFIRVIEDISERKRAEETVASERALLRTIIDSVPDYIYVKDAAGRFQLANKAWLNERGTVGEELVGKTVFDVFSPPELAQKMAEQDAAIVKGGAPIIEREQLVILKTPDGKPGRAHWTSITKVPMHDATGHIIGTVGISRDVTEQKLSARRRDMGHAVTRMLAEHGSLDQVMKRILEAVCEALEWDCAAYWQWDESAERLERVETWSTGARGVPHSAAGDGANARAPSGEALPASDKFVRDIWRSGAPAWSPVSAQEGYNCAFGFPILAGEKALGVMEFYGHDIKQPDSTLLQLVRAIGSQIGQAIQRKEAEQALRVSEERYRDQFEASPLPMWVWDDEALRFLAVNQAAIDHYGYTRAEFLRMSVRDIWAPDEKARYEENLRGRAGEHTLHLQRRHRIKDGRVIDVEVTARRFMREGRSVWLTLVNDISERKRTEAALRESEEQFLQLANNIPQVFWITDVKQKETLYLSPATEVLIGYPLQQIRESPRILVRATHEEDRVRVYAARKTAAVGGYDETYRIVRPDGTIRWIHDRAFPVRDAAGNAYRIAGIAEDITERKLAEERLMHLAHYDVLTNLPNRVLYYDRLRQALAQAKRNKWIVGVMLIDVDRFKNVNDTLGHAVGDRLLQQVSERLTKSVRAGDTVGRLGGDEFAIVLTNITSADDANLVAQKIMASFKDPFRPESGSEIYVTASIGITLYPADSTDQDTLIKNADTAMYRAKDVGRNAYRFYTPEMNLRALEMLSMESGLRGALDRQELLLYYQPKVSLMSGETVGVEALLRWHNPERGVVSPGEFMPVMEETGLIVPVGEWVVKAVCAQIAEWQKAGIAPKSVAINLSPRQFIDKELEALIRRILDEYQVDPEQIEFEITESSLMANTEESIRTLEALGQLGVGLSIDDFGTGYSSLGYLRRFPLDALKIDRSFVRDITTSADDATITRAVISMAHSLGLKVIAEGVETEEQLAFLAEHGCDECQGYYFSPPMTADECAAWLAAKRTVTRPGPLRPNAPIVLLVDDDNDALSLLKRALTKDDYRILTASSAREGLELLGKNKVDVVISNQNMRGVPGMDFLRRVRMQFPDTMRMMTSEHSDLKEVADAMEAGEIFRFLPKSLDEGQLRADVRDALQQKGL